MKMPNISETGRETFTKFSQFLSVIPMQNMEGICPPNFGGKGKKVEPLTPYLQNWRPKGSNFFVQLGALEYSKM